MFMNAAVASEICAWSFASLAVSQLLISSSSTELEEELPLESEDLSLEAEEVSLESEDLSLEAEEVSLESEDLSLEVDEISSATEEELSLSDALEELSQPKIMAQEATISPRKRKCFIRTSMNTYFPAVNCRRNIEKNGLFERPFDIESFKKLTNLKKRLR